MRVHIAEKTNVRDFQNGCRDMLALNHFQARWSRARPVCLGQRDVIAAKLDKIDNRPA